MRFHKPLRTLRTRLVSYFGLAAMLGVMALMGHPMLVMGASMEPRLHSGQLLWLDRAAYRNRVPAPGEVVVFRHQGATYVKRVFRGPGDRVNFLGGHGCWAQGPIRQADIQHLRQRLSAPRTALCNVKSLRVPEGFVFVIGDNRQCSEDSRHFGPIPVEAIVGRAIAPVDRFALQYYCPPKFRQRAVAHKEGAGEAGMRHSGGNGQTAS